MIGAKAKSRHAEPAEKTSLLKTILMVSGIVVVLIAIVYLATDGSKKELALGLVLATLPLALYAAIRRPFIFPFTLFVVLVPFDSLLSLSSSFGTLTKLVAICSGLAFLFLLIRNKRHVPLSKAVLLWLGLLVWMSLSVFWAIDPAATASKLITYAQLMALYVIISLVPITEGEYKAFLFAVVLGGIASAGYAVYLYHSGHHVQLAQINGQMTSRVLVRFDSGERLGPDDVAAALLLPISIVLTWALQRSWSLTKIALIGIFLLLVGGLYANASRGALVAVAVMIGYMILRGRFKAQLITLSLVGLAASFLSPTSPWARFTSAISTGGTGRLSIWEVAWEAFKRHWLIGAGTGNFPIAYNQSFISVYQSYYAHWTRAPHNNLVEVSVELGVIGLVLLLCAWYAQWRSLRFIDASNRLFDIRIGLEAAILSMFVASLFVGTMAAKDLWLLFELMAVTRTFALLSARTPGAGWIVSPGARHESQYLERPVLKEPINA